MGGPSKFIWSSPWEYGPALYRKRNEVERLYRWLKGFHCMFSRSGRIDVVFLFLIYFALVVEALKLCKPAVVKIMKNVALKIVAWLELQSGQDISHGILWKFFLCMKCYNALGLSNQFFSNTMTGTAANAA